MCPEIYFQRYYTLQDYYFDDNWYNGPRRLKEGRGRPFHREEEGDRYGINMLGTVDVSLSEYVK